MWWDLSVRLLFAPTVGNKVYAQMNPDKPWAQMEMDSVTKWLIRVASAMIILIGFTLILVIPIIAITISSKLAIAQDSIKATLELLLQQILA